MGKYKSFEPEAEAIGQSMLGFIECLRREEIRPYLEAHGLTDIQPNGWYPVQQWLDVLSDLSEDRPGQAMFDFVAIGMQISQTSSYPPEFEKMSFFEVLQAAAVAHNSMQHRNYSGRMKVERIGPRHIRVAIRVPYPDDLMYGATYGVTRRFLKGVPFTVAYDDVIPRREQGGDETVFHIVWENA